MSTIQVNSIVDIPGTGAPDFPNGLTSTGNVGIGTSSPTTKLDVVGTVKASVIDAENLIAQVSFFARNTAPTGWLKANGAVVSRTTYSALFAVIGTTFGAGDGSTTFALPDLRGEFLRGWDDGRGVDTGRGFGLSQLQSTELLYAHIDPTVSRVRFQSVSGVPQWTANRQDDDAGAAVNTNHTTGVLVSPRNSGETRPRNIAMLACIKF